MCVHSMYCRIPIVINDAYTGWIPSRSYLPNTKGTVLVNHQVFMSKKVVEHLNKVGLSR